MNASRLCDQDQAVLYGDTEQPDETDERRDIPRFARNEQRQDSADERAGNRRENHAGLGERSKRQIEQAKHRNECGGNRDGQRLRGALLLLDAASDFDEIPRRRLKPDCQLFPHLCGGASEVSARHTRFNGYTAVSSFAPDSPRCQYFLDARNLVDWHPGSVVCLQSQVANCGDTVTRCVGESNHQVIPPLADPHL